MTHAEVAANEVASAETKVKTTGDVTGAADSLVNEAQSHFVRDNVVGDEAYLTTMNEKLVKDGLLPSVTLAYLNAGGNFDKGNVIDKDSKLTREEVEQFISKNLNNPNGDRNTILDRQMYQNLLKYMDENGQMKSIDRSQLTELRQVEQRLFEKNKVQEAYYNARVLLNPNDNNETVLSRIESMPRGQSQFTRDDLDRYRQRQLDADPKFALKDECKALDWMYDNWNDPVVKKTLLDNGRLTKAGFDTKLQNLASTYDLTTNGPASSSPVPDSNIVAQPAGRPDGNSPGTGVTDLLEFPEATNKMKKDNRPLVPNDNPDPSKADDKHNYYFSDGKGNTVALRGKDKNDPDVITLGAVKKGTNGVDNVHYTGWVNDRANNRWILYDGQTPLAIADKVEVNNKTGQVKISPRYTPIAQAQGVM